MESSLAPLPCSGSDRLELSVDGIVAALAQTGTGPASRGSSGRSAQRHQTRYPAGVPIWPAAVQSPI